MVTGARSDPRVIPGPTVRSTCAAAGGAGAVDEQEGHQGDEPRDHAARPPSSVSAVMTYVPLFSSRSSVTMRCLAASSRSFENVE